MIRKAFGRSVMILMIKLSGENGLGNDFTFTKKILYCVFPVCQNLLFFFICSTFKHRYFNDSILKQMVYFIRELR